MKMVFKKSTLLVLFIAVSLIFTACAGNSNNEPGPDPDLVPTQVVEEPPATPTAPPPTPEVVLPTPTPEPEEEIPATGEELVIAGAAIYLDACAGCHQNDGSGVDGVYPPLNNNPFVTAENAQGVTAVIITGRGGMPTFHNILDEDEIAAVVSYIRNGWDNSASTVSADEVNEVWEETGMPQEEDEEEE
jgi:mono/diheme cytochrome c family protein